jgi:hypothetical protein
MDEQVPSEWQRRYDESVEAERARSRERDPAERGTEAVDVAGWLPGLIGFVAVVVTTLIVVLRRSIRRT